MRTIEKAVAATFVVGVLGAQALAIFPPTHRSVDWYWPFTNYPMYSAARLPGEVFREHAIRLRLPDRDGATHLVETGIGEVDSGDDRLLSVDHEDLRIHHFTYFRMLDLIGGWSSGRSGWDDETARENMELLERSISAQLSLDEYEVVLLKREFPIGPRGLEDPDPPWVEVHAWPVSAEPADVLTGEREGRR